MTLTELAIKRPTLVVVFFSFFGVLGIFGFLQMNYDLMPKMSPPIVTITTIYPGGSPNEVESSVTKVIEDAVSGIDKVVAIRSYSSEGRSFIFVEFEQNVNIDLSLQDAQRKVNEALFRLPKDTRIPVLSKLAFDEIPVLRMAVKSKLKAKEFYQFVKDNIQPRFAKISGVGNISIQGGEEREIHVNMNLNKLQSYSLSPFLVVQTIKAANVDFPTGKIKETENQFIVRVAGKFRKIDELRELVIGKSRQGGEINLSDVANVVDAYKEITNINRLNGVNSIGVTVQKQSNANTVEVSDKVKKEIAALEKENKNIGLEFDVAQDASVFIMQSAKAVWVDLGLAIVLVSMIMLIFLHSLRNSLIIMVAIPTSLISTFFIMYMFGFTFNMMTLLAMSLVIGILVDDSIVVLENIYRHLEMGKGKFEAALTGRNEIGFAALSITLVDVVVFVPLALITGMIGNFLREYALVVVFSTLMSLLVSFTVTPVLASRFTKLQHFTKHGLFGSFGFLFEEKFRQVTEQYRKTLNWSLNHGWMVVVLTILLFVSSFMLAGLGFIGFEFIPSVDRGEIIVTIEVDPGSTIENTNQYALQVEKMLSKMPEVEGTLTNVGISSEGLLGTASNNNAEIYVTVIDKSKRDETIDLIGQRIRQKVHYFPGIRVRVAPVTLMGTSTRTPIELLVTGTNYDSVVAGARLIENIVRNTKGATDIRLSSEEGKPELKIDIDREKLALFGLSVFDIGQNLRIALTGDDDSKYREGISEYAIRIQFDQFDRSNPDEVGNLSFLNIKGQHIKLKQFAKITQDIGPTRLEREDRISSIKVQSQVFGRTSGIITQDIRSQIDKIKLPTGVTWKVTGEQKNMMDSMKNLLYAIVAGILFVYMIMIALYDSYKFPFVVLFSIPLAMVGALYALALTSTSISIYSMLGIIMLIGLVAKNAILLVDRTNQMKYERGYSTFDALIEAGQTRLRPILMTTFSMVFGMMPIALSTSAGGEAKSGLAIVLIGGLLSSLFLTLVLVPVVYQSFDRFGKSKVRLKSTKIKDLSF